MKRLCRSVSFALFFLLLGILPALHAQEGRYDVTVLLPDDSTSARWETDDRRFLSSAFEMAGVSYTILNAKRSVETQLEQARTAISNGTKVILMVNLDSTSGARIIDLARRAGVWIIDYDRLTIQGRGADFYVSFNNDAVGRLQGEGIVRAVEEAELSEPVRVALLNGSPTDNNATLYKQGYESVLKPKFDSGAWLKVADEAVPEWDNDEAYRIFERMLDDNDNRIDAVVAANDGLAGRVVAALEARNLPYLPLTGQDATVEAIQNILAGKQSMTVYKAIKAEAEAAAALAVALVKGDDPSGLVNGITNNGVSEVPSVLLFPIPVTRENIAETVIADGFRTWEEICVGEFAQFCPAPYNEANEAESTPEATQAP
jgi:D-xylose transport system substrate-binding protein